MESRKYIGIYLRIKCIGSLVNDSRVTSNTPTSKTQASIASLKERWPQNDKLSASDANRRGLQEKTFSLDLRFVGGSLSTRLSRMQGLTSGRCWASTQGKPHAWVNRFSFVPLFQTVFQKRGLSH